MIVSNVENIDCIEGMKQFPDNYFDLAICDPEYGIKVNTFGCGSRSKKYDRSKNNNWDSQPPTQAYFDELFRVSKNQIIWGGNYFGLPPTRCFIVWDKKQPEKMSFSMAEYAWTSFNRKSFIFYGRRKDEVRIHQTQKPILLYEWILRNFAKQGDKILDPNMGSQSSRIAAYKNGFDYWGFEINENYFIDGSNRFSNYSFDAPKEMNCRQLSLA